MEDKKQEKNQDVLELIEDSLGDVSGGVYSYKGANIDSNRHWHENEGELNPRSYKGIDINPEWEQRQRNRGRLGKWPEGR